MTSLEAILKEVDCLSVGARAQLVQILLAEMERNAEADEVATGQRGLAAWTESTANESWSDFYPDTLRGREGSSP
ncbi:MAG: hypothetical protein V3W34_09105 [Phycisphaerae bacterium]